MYIESANRLPLEREEAYLDDVRVERSVSLQRSHREACLEVLRSWEEWLQVGELCDIDGLTNQAAEYLWDDGVS